MTLVGPGGVGKTRLAIRVAGDLATAFADGVRFVPLAGVSDPERVADAVARALGSTHVPGSAVQAVLVAALREAETLLVLDNFEHVLAAAPLVTDLLAACPRLVVLVTSRTMLRVSGERAFPVPPLDVPAPGEAIGLGDMTHTSAVRLFAARAGNVAPSFALTPATVPIVADICRRLDGLPLAIELAAARANYLPLGTMRDRLERRLALLTGGPRDASPRHRTMHDAIAWSYDLLTQEEQVTFRRLAVFAGGFSLDAAETVVRSDGVLDMIGSLVDKSLVRHEALESDARFVMLETIREFAAEQLAASGEDETTHHAHAAYFLDFAEHHTVAPFLPDDGPRLAELAAEDANLRAAMAWLAAHGEGSEGSEGPDLARLVAALGWYWLVRGHLQDEHVWFERVLAHAGAAPAVVRAKISLAFGLTLLMRGESRRPGTGCKRVSRSPVGRASRSARPRRLSGSAWPPPPSRSMTARRPILRRPSPWRHRWTIRDSPRRWRARRSRTTALPPAARAGSRPRPPTTKRRSSGNARWGSCARRRSPCWTWARLRASKATLPARSPLSERG